MSEVKYTFESTKQEGETRQVLIRFATEKEKKEINPMFLFDTLDECKEGIEVDWFKLSDCDVYYSHQVVNEMVSKILKR